MDEELEQIAEQMELMRHMSHEDLLIFAASLIVKLKDKSIPDGYTLETYALRMLQKGAELGKTYRAKINQQKAAENDPKQKDKKLVYACWNDWQKEPSRYDSKSAFARDMLDKFENLRSQRVIAEKWCTEFESGGYTPG